MHDDRRERQRVAANIGAVVLAFCRERLRQGGRFHMQELVDYVREHELVTAPESAGRILRLLRRAGTVDVELVERSSSLYEVRGVGNPKSAHLARGFVGGAPDNGAPKGLFGDMAPAKGPGQGPRHRRGEGALSMAIPNGELNPNKPIVREVRQEWHKFVALLMFKHDQTKVRISGKDIERFMQAEKKNITIRAADDFIELALVDDAEALRLANEEGGLPCGSN